MGLWNGKGRSSSAPSSFQERVDGLPGRLRCRRPPVRLPYPAFVIVTVVPCDMSNATESITCRMM